MDGNFEVINSSAGLGILKNKIIKIQIISKRKKWETADETGIV